MYTNPSFSFPPEATSWPSDISPAIELNAAGLVFGQGTELIRLAKGGTGLAFDADRDRCLALLSVAIRQPAAPMLLVHLKAASHWQRGDKALANFRLVFAGLPKLHEPADAYRLRAAEYLLDGGMSPRELMTELGLDGSTLDLGKYDPDQPRVLAGSGPESGRWSNGTAGDGPESNADNASSNPAAQWGSAPDGTPIVPAASADDPQGLKAFRAAAKAAGLTTKDEMKAFHLETTGQGITDFNELVEIAKSVKKPP